MEHKVFRENPPLEKDKSDNSEETIKTKDI